MPNQTVQLDRVFPLASPTRRAVLERSNARSAPRLDRLDTDLYDLKEQTR